MVVVFIGGIAVGAFFGFLISSYFTEPPEETEAINCALCYEQMRKRYLEELDEKIRKCMVIELEKRRSNTERSKENGV